MFIFIINVRGKYCIHIIDQGVNFRKLAKKISKFKSWENDFWRTLVAFWSTVRRSLHIVKGVEMDTCTCDVNSDIAFDMFPVEVTYRQLRARRALLQIKNVPLRTRRELLPLTLYSDSALLVLNGTSLSCNNALLALK